jgi:hypothetical protein
MHTLVLALQHDNLVIFHVSDGLAFFIVRIHTCTGNRPSANKEIKMQVNTKTLITNIAISGWAVVHGKAMLKSAKELASTGLFKLVPSTIGGVDCYIIKLTIECKE